MPKQRHVAFSGAEVIEYNAALAPVVKLCGALGCVNGSSLMLECEARGLEVSDERLTLHYIEELQRSLRSRGFEPMSCDLKELQTQRQVVELLLAWTTLGHQPVTWTRRRCNVCNWKRSNLRLAWMMAMRSDVGSSLCPHTLRH
ncbi:hypothetical protein L914_02417 [Phytophthora nicotianae]|uniref:Uncharacterized protein n=1 Tax=Phytophthora nicotianae TaxID=4792 RepID=W2P0I1_PHYNI|nr:hypothetical protein L914_02417 [Phytophthora nicotianae]